ncbi:hypothetical protein [Pseudomonas fluorescens]|uniref:Uncharacterized protein n=1 Tax=Pseudomonas fluorescens TaxID=294 RepID=A0A5E7T0A0_PSEFL|nr:hypothetical protein [Pseudomonas fluorescens]VVN87532.1 hypothetical protein PS833_01599 [Pseudomonas fluorescens]VVP89093.1 hypothetical protein PS914_02956 [Pseudomonas fluorescens]
MSSNRQKSFLATLSFNNKPVSIISHAGNTVPVWGQNNDGAADVLYFRCDGDDYTLYIRSEGDHFGKIINAIDIFFTANTATSPTTFNIIDTNNEIVTLDKLSDNQAIRLKTRDGEILKSEFTWGNDPERIVLDGRRLVTFDLNILERNVSYLSTPDEI